MKHLLRTGLKRSEYVFTLLRKCCYAFVVTNAQTIFVIILLGAYLGFTYRTLRGRTQFFFIYVLIKLEFKLEVRKTGSLSSTLKEHARKAQKRPGGKAPRFPNADGNT